MIPIGDETPSTKLPVVTCALVAANVLVFALSWSSGTAGFTQTLHRWGFTPAKFSAATILTSMFLHGGLLHLAGNMLYLWIFGDNVEDVLGRPGFLAFYLAMGVCAALGQYAFDPSASTPMVGASGAVSGVLGAHLLLFPHNRVRILWLLYLYVRVFSVKAGWALAFYFALQVVYAALLGPYSHVAYWAHIAGFGAGAALVLALLAAKVITKPRALSTTRTSRLASSRGPGLRPAVAYAGAGLSTGAAVAGEMADAAPSAGEGGGSDDPGARVRAILAALERGDLDQAMESTRRELRLTGRRAASPDSLAVIGDAFYRRRIYPVAFEAYRAFLSRAPQDNDRLPEVAFLAGIIASRYLRDFQKARDLLRQAASTHYDQRRVDAARTELAAIEANLARTAADSSTTLLSGPCAVIRQTGGMINIAEVGRIVATLTGKALADVTRMMRGSVGFLATDVEPMKARELAVRLQEMGIPVLVVTMDKLVVRPDAQTVRWAAVTAEGVSFKTDYTAGEPVARKWSDVFYASAGIVGFSKQKRVADPFSSGGGHYAASPMGTAFGGVRIDDGDEGKWTYKEEKVESVVFDVFTLNPFECYRLLEEDLYFTGSPQGTSPSRHMNFVHLLSDFLALGGAVPANEGVSLVASDAPLRRWRGLTFNSIRDFEQYNYWRLQLEQYG